MTMRVLLRYVLILTLSVRYLLNPSSNVHTLEVASNIPAVDTEASKPMSMAAEDMKVSKVKVTVEAMEVFSEGSAVVFWAVVSTHYIHSSKNILSDLLKSHRSCCITFGERIFERR